MTKRFSYWNSIDKPKVMAGIKQSGIAGKNAIKTIITFERRICTCRNMIDRGVSWETVNFSDAYNSASIAADELITHGYVIAKYDLEWKAYCKARGYAKDCDIGDFMA